MFIVYAVLLSYMIMILITYLIAIKFASMNYIYIIISIASLMIIVIGILSCFTNNDEGKKCRIVNM